MNKNLITVVTVTYNADDLLEETIQSVINQSYEHIEYIIIDGASTDGTINIIKTYEDKIDYWVSEPDEGIYFAMNKAIEKATGNWINFMNAGDTFFDFDTINYVMKHKNKDSELVYGDCQIGPNVKKPHDISGFNNLTSLCHQTLFIKTDLMKEALFDTRYRISADHDFILKMFQENKVFQYLDKPISNYLLNGLSDTEILRLYIEGLTVLFTNNVPENDIIKSPWYKDLSKYICKPNENHINLLKKELLDKEKTIQMQEQHTRQLSDLQEAVQKIASYSIWRQPLKKYQSYKAMLLNYDQIKGSKIEKK